MKVCLCFEFFGMLRQSNMAPQTLVAFNLICNTCRGDIIVTPTGLPVVINRTKTVRWLPLLPIPHIPSHPADSLQAYKHLITASPTTSPDQPLLTIIRGTRIICVTVGMLCEALRVMLATINLKMDYSLYSL